MATSRKTSSTKAKTTTRRPTRSVAKPKTAAPGAATGAKTEADAVQPLQGVTIEAEAAAEAGTESVAGAATEATAATGASATPELKSAFTKRELLARVRASSGAKGRDVRAVADAVLAELGDALGRGETVKLEPLGTVRVQRQKSAGSADVLALKLRRKKRAPEPKDPLAEVAE